MLMEALQEWGLTSKDPAVVTDNTANIACAMEIMQLMHVWCFAHIFNLASQAGLKIPAMSPVVARVGRIAMFFHRSTIGKPHAKRKTEAASTASAQADSRCCD